MSPEPQQPNSGNTNAEIAFVQQALALQTGQNAPPASSSTPLASSPLSPSSGLHLHLFPPETLGGLLHSLLRVDLFFLVLLFAITMYLRQAINQNTRTILRALANTRNR